MEEGIVYPLGVRIGAGGDRNEPLLGVRKAEAVEGLSPLRRELSAVGTHQGKKTVNEQFHLARHSEKTEGKARDEDVCRENLRGQRGHVVPRDHAPSRRPSPTGKTAAAGGHVQVGDVSIFSKREQDTSKKESFRQPKINFC